MDLTLIQSIISAVQDRNWYPAIAFIITGLIAIWRVIQPQVWDKIPSNYKTIPALLLSSLTAFVTAFSSGETWQVAIAIGIYTILSTWPTSIGIAETILRFVNKQPEKTE